jgi:hypothetical protein
LKYWEKELRVIKSVFSSISICNGDDRFSKCKQCQRGKRK